MLPRRYLKFNQTSKILNNYSKVKNKSIEHIIPKSYVGKNNIICYDIHNLLLWNKNLNQKRKNYKYKNLNDNFELLDLQGNYTDKKNYFTTKIDFHNKLCEPLDRDKGIIARSISYSIFTYNLMFLVPKLIDIETLLSWHIDFPVKEFEYKRNILINQVQGNENIFISQNEKLLLNYIQKIYIDK